MTKDFSFYVIDLGVDYAEDTDRAVQAAQDTSDELMADPAYGPSILAPLEILGVDAYDDSQVTIKMRIKTVPSKQWMVGREFRRRLKKTFDARHIVMPFPQRTLRMITVPEGLRPAAVPLPPAADAAAPGHEDAAAPPAGDNP